LLVGGIYTGKNTYFCFVFSSERKVPSSHILQNLNCHAHISTYHIFILKQKWFFAKSKMDKSLFKFVKNSSKQIVIPKKKVFFKNIAIIAVISFGWGFVKKIKIK